MRQTVVIADGAMGTMLQEHSPTLEDYQQLEAVRPGSLVERSGPPKLVGRAIRPARARWSSLPRPPHDQREIRALVSGDLDELDQRGVSRAVGPSLPPVEARGTCDRQREPTAQPRFRR